MFSLDGVKCQDRLLIPDWIWLQSADAAAHDTPEKASRSALNALVLTAESRAIGRALGHSDLSLSPNGDQQRQHTSERKLLRNRKEPLEIYKQTNRWK